MPQLSQLALVYQSQWFWLLLTLAVIYFYVGRGIVGKVEATVDDRDAKIAADLAEAQRLQDEAEATEEAWRERINAARADAQEVTSAAKAASTAENEARVAAASQEIDAKVAAAEAEIAQQREGALAEVERVAAEATQDIVARLTGETVDEAAARGAVSGAMSHA